MAIEPRRIAGRIIVGALLTVAGYYAIWGGEYTAFDLRRLGVQQDVEAQRLAETRAEVDSLSLMIERLESDPKTIEAIARERFGMVRDGELLYRFVDVDPVEETPQTP